MNETILSVENVSKQYQLGVFGTGSLGGDIKRWWCRLNGKEDPFLKIGDINDRSVRSDSGLVWALRDINFEVRRGEALGIIGANGAGKSTLLKLLSRVTKPTTGEIKYNGRLASLLEVGTGFHPELTGRENIYLNGGILGMPRFEINRKLDEIIDFSGCEKYIDTPVKRYSSGMRVRLGFAVAAFLDPDILIVDEVLAVGDADFQNKAIGKMQSVSSEEGRTVLFVSHNMASVSVLCNRGLLLVNGSLSKQGTIEEIINDYLIRKDNSSEFDNIKERKGSGQLTFKSAQTYSNRSDKNKCIVSGGNLFIELKMTHEESCSLEKVTVDLRIDSSIGNRLIWLSTSKYIGWKIQQNTILFYIDKLPLNEGTYIVTLHCKVNGIVSDWIKNAFSFNVENLTVSAQGKKIDPKQSPIILDYDIL
jgi:lipopolysaccharide transport system ATP-binding protein